MPTNPDIWPLPRYDVGQPKHIHALGVVAAMYNQLEFALFCLLLDYTNLGSETTQWLFANTSNNVRLELLKRAVKVHEPDASTREHVLHFADCFDVCAENRNVLMHSMVAKAEDAELLNFAKASRTNPSKVNSINLRLEDIRRTADEISTMFGYGTRLHTTFIVTKSEPTPEFNQLAADLQLWLSTLPSKPRLPNKLLKQNP